MSAVTEIYSTEGITIITFEEAPAHIGFVSELFLKVADAKINIDMISQTAPKGESNTISFTVQDNDLPALLEIINGMKDDKKALTPYVSTGNVKLSLYGSEMPKLCGVAADVFARLAANEIDTLLMTTSDVDISIVVSNANSDSAYSLLKSAYIK